MKKSERLESVILLVATFLLLPIWLLQSKQIQISESLLSLLQILQWVLLIVLVVILIRRFRRVQAALRENKNRKGPFPF